jgi:hypothetical protein
MSSGIRHKISDAEKSVYQQNYKWTDYKYGLIILTGRKIG